MPAPTRALGYVRLSKMTDASTSPERQRQDIERLVTAREWTLVDVIEDLDVSASRRRLDRPGIHEMRRRLKAGEADVVVVAKFDRIARSVSDVTTLHDDGVMLVSVAEDFDMTTNMGRAMVQILQIFAELEARTIGSRVSSSRRHLPTVGRWPGGPEPYGMQNAPHPDGAGRTLIHHPEEAKVVRRMVDAVLAGTSVNQLARDLTADGVPARRSDYWSPATVARILRHGSLKGWATLTKDYVRDERGLPAVVWPPHLTPEEGRALDRVMQTRTSTVRHGPTNALLHGVAICSGCWLPLTPRFFSRPDQAAVYACQSRNRGRVCPSPQTVTAAPAELEAERLFLAAFGQVEMIETVQVDAEHYELEDVTSAISSVLADMARPGADIAALSARLQPLAAERDRLTALPSTRPEQRSTGITYAEAWAAGDIAKRRALMIGAEAYVTVYPAERRGRWNPERIQLSDELAGDLEN